MDVAASASTPTASFHPFSRLPAELRVRVWSFTIWPRNVDFIMCGWQNQMNDNSFASSTTLKQRNAVPAILHVCRESRYEGMNFYTLLRHSITGLGIGYFNFDLDTLFISPRSSKDVKYHASQCSPAPWTNAMFFRLTSIAGNYVPTPLAELSCIGKQINIEQLHLIKTVVVPWDFVFLGFDLSREYMFCNMRGIRKITFMFEAQFARSSRLVSDMQSQLRAEADDTRARFPDWVEPQWEFEFLD
ncbi:uncharacterized protein LY89DRAFT_686607 [Mollisia scopiformis]|uniref:2EXR domain-containing protein n=1 Tax=Mollisia scopiformis TaxID=149040 RepID=A0A194X4D7_MOLSC|nr:uncharacterized protein LY89DRAFT_686607 [Mollisia scopiformis]KUJ15043.1 hypothetical protein LY89DRAFT_686607 [Mollisia scopiformis]